MLKTRFLDLHALTSSIDPRCSNLILIAWMPLFHVFNLIKHSSFTRRSYLTCNARRSNLLCMKNFPLYNRLCDLEGKKKKTFLDMFSPFQTSYNFNCTFLLIARKIYRCHVAMMYDFLCFMVTSDH